MGYEVDRFVNQVDEEFLCSICLGVFEAPVHGPCGHTFCGKCIEEWIPVNVNACPLDKKPLFKKDLTAISIPFRNLLNRLEIKCEFESEGCKNVCQMSRLASHIKLCPFNPDGEMICDQGCELTFPRRLKDDHHCIPALQKIISEQRIEICDLNKKLGNKRTYDAAFFSRYGDRLTMEMDAISERRAELRARIIQDRVRTGIASRDPRLRTPDPSTPSSSGSTASSNSRIIAQLSAGPSSSTHTCSSTASSSSANSSRYLTVNEQMNELRRERQHEEARRASSQLASRLATSGLVNIRGEIDLPQLEVQVRRLTDEDLESYGVPPLNSTSGTSSSSALQAGEERPSYAERTTDRLEAMRERMAERYARQANQERHILLRRSLSSNNAISLHRERFLPSRPLPDIPSSSNEANLASQSSVSSQSSSSSSSQSSNSSSPTNSSSSPERMGLLTQMLSQGSGCPVVRGPASSSTRND